MKMVGITKEIDNLGRLVIPKELRERFGLGKTVELIATREGVLIKNPSFVLVEISDSTDKCPENDN